MIPPGESYVDCPEGGMPCEHKIRAVAFHLPQFHPIPENDEWWGKGFTEWTKVVAARPLFGGHYQPHLPTDLGFYDLRLPEARAAQARLAAEYGIYGFCYFHYWFLGRRVLERPVNEIWKSGEPDFPFCLCWANENWTRKWDGQETEVLLEQVYSRADDVAHIRALIPMFLDPRYIRVRGRPMFLVYRAAGLPAPQKTTEIWRDEAERAGLNGLFLVRVDSFHQSGDARETGFDCSVDFPPHGRPINPEFRIFRTKWWHRGRLGTAEPALLKHGVYDYEKFVESALAVKSGDYPHIPCVCPSWDNSPRRNEDATIFANSTPERYERWLREIVARRKAQTKAVDSCDTEDSLIFINAWNEWGEGNHLEPCVKWGRRYLEATQRALGVGANESLEHAHR